MKHPDMSRPTKIDQPSQAVLLAVKLTLQEEVISGGQTAVDFPAQIEVAFKRTLGHYPLLPGWREMQSALWVSLNDHHDPSYYFCKCGCNYFSCIMWQQRLFILMLAWLKGMFDRAHGVMRSIVSLALCVSQIEWPGPGARVSVRACPRPEMENKWSG